MSGSVSPCHVLVIYDALKDRSEGELEKTVNSLRLRGDILRTGDVLVVLGIIQTLQHPMGFHMKAYSENFMTNDRATEKEVSKKADSYAKMLAQVAEICQDEGICIEVKVTAGFPIKQVILQEVMAINASWAILDRHFRREMRYQTKQIPCKVGFIQDDLWIKTEKLTADCESEVIEQKNFISYSKPVTPANSVTGLNVSESFQKTDTDQSTTSGPRHSFTSTSSHSSRSFFTSSSQEKSAMSEKSLPPVHRKSKRQLLQHRCSEAPILCTACGSKTETYYIKDAMVFTYAEIQFATNDFAKRNLLGEGGFGHVYKGKLRDGQLIAAKVRKEESSQGLAEFHSEVYVLSFARHKNIVMLLGYCSREKLNILVYEYICNKSLHWHLFDKSASPLEWHQRFAIAIGTAKGLRFLHEECRGGPIIHRDVRPSNILLTHDFTPMLGDFGLAKWKFGDDPFYTRVFGTLGYLAPEYAENGIVSVRTDVFAYGIILLQLISGRKVLFRVPGEEETQHSLRQWAEVLLEKLALHELIDPRIADSHDTHELYLMAKAANSCIKRSPEMRPSIGEVVRLLEGENDHFNHLGEQFLPRYSKMKEPN